MALALPPRHPESRAETACGLAYYRVSTSEQANTSFDEDGFSIQAQREYCHRKANEMGVQLVDEYVDRGKSARTADRPALQAMLARVKEDTDIQYVFVHKLDRLARNRADDVQIGLLLAKNGVRLVSCTENIDDTPSGKLVRGIMADIAEWYSANLSEEAKKGMRKKVENGGTPRRAPIGYVNARRKIVELGKDIGVIELHETNAPIITDCFKLYATGHCTLDDVAVYANDRGLRMPATRRLPERPITSKYMRVILHNRYYLGRVIYGGVEYPGEHAPLVDEAIFTRVQALLLARSFNKDKSHKRPHHLKGTLFCALCGRRMGITVQTKRCNGVAYPYFYCLGRQDNRASCSQGYIPVGDIEDAVHAYWGNICIPAERAPTLRQAILANFAGQHEESEAEIIKQKRRITEFEQRHKKAKAAYYADALSLDEFKAEQETIQRGIQSARAIITTWTVERESITQALDDALLLMMDPQALYDELPEGLKPLLVQAVFQKLWVLDNRVVGSDLTESLAELLTLEARIAWSAKQPRKSRVESATYQRLRVPLTVPYNAVVDEWDRLYAERPHGVLPIDTIFPCVRGGRSSNIAYLVGVRRLKLESALREYLYKWQHDNHRAQTSYVSPRRRPWRIRKRLSGDDVAKLIAAFKAGTPKWQLAEQYGIGFGSVRQVLRAAGVKKRSGHNTRL